MPAFGYFPQNVHMQASHCFSLLPAVTIYWCSLPCGGEEGARHRSVLCSVMIPCIFSHGHLLSGSNYWRNRVLKVAKEFKNKIYFAVASKSQQGRALDEMGLASSTADVVVAARGTKEEKFPMEGKFRYLSFT